MADYDSTGVRATMLRGGTSRGLYFEPGDLPTDPATRDDLLLRLVGTPHTEVYDERISDVQIRVDGNFATAWMNYTFYVVSNGTDQLSHCGVNAFHFFRGTDGWKITQITDTRRREGCPALPAGSR